MDDDAVEAVIYKTRRSPNSRVNESMKIFHTERRTSVGRKTIKRRPGKRRLDGKDFLLADEIDYIRSRAAEYNGRLVTVGPLVLFSTETGDAWLLDPADHLAVRLARDGDPENVYSRRPAPTLQSAGRATTRLMAIPSSSSTATLPASPPSSVIQPAASLSWANREISNIFG